MVNMRMVNARQWCLWYAYFAWFLRFFARFSRFQNPVKYIRILRINHDLAGLRHSPAELRYEKKPVQSI